MLRDSFQIRRASKTDAAEIGRIHVAATRNAYRDIYTDAYLDGLSPEKRASAWLEAGTGHLAVNDPSIAIVVAVERGTIIGFADVGSADLYPGYAEVRPLS